MAKEYLYKVEAEFYHGVITAGILESLRAMSHDRYNDELQVILVRRVELEQREHTLTESERIELARLRDVLSQLGVDTLVVETRVEFHRLKETAANA